MQIYEAMKQTFSFVTSFLQLYPIQHEKGGVYRNTLQSVFEHYTKISIGDVSSKE